MNRREVLAGLGAVVALRCAEARAQQSKSVRIGYLEPQAASDPTAQNLRRQLLLGLRDLGHVEGRNFTLEVRNADGQLDRLSAFAAELVRVPVDIIVAAGDAPIQAARQATDKIPIVMLIAGDPVGSGFVASLARPGGNITGLSSLASDMASKRVELLKEVVPRASSVAVLWNSSNQSKLLEWKETEAAAKIVGVALQSVEAHASADFDAAFASIAHKRPDAMITFAESLTIAFRERIGAFALANRLPMISEIREFAVAGALATYGISRPDLWRRSAVYIDKIMRGANPSDLPVEQPTRFEMTINLKAAKVLGVEVAPTMLTRADEVIE
jgi:putative ABC transport system substrate-binding protein